MFSNVYVVVPETENKHLSSENKYNKDQSVNAYLRDGGTYWACYSSGTANTLYKKAVGSKHSVACATGLSYGSISASPSSAYEGQPVALTATPDDGYMLDSWDVYKTGDASTKITVKNNSFVMPGYDVTVSATFRVQHTYTLVDGSTITLVPGKHYLIASTNSTDYYVMGAQNGSVRNSVPASLSGSQILEDDDFYEVVISGDDTNKWTMYSVKDEGYLYATGAGSANINVREDNVTTNPTYGQWSISVSSGTATITSVASVSYNKFTYNHNGGTNPRFACYSTAQTAVKLYVRDGDTDLEFYSPTTITTNVTIADNEVYTVEKGQVLTFSGTLTNNGDASNLIIEDGGQLIASNSVPATVKKTITSASTKDADQHWYTISTPAHKGSNNYVVIDETNLTSGDYDMFYLDETQGKWINKKTAGGGTGFDNMNVAQGYLYRSNTTSLEIAGNTNTGDDITYTLTKTGDGAISGFNLLGNPYPHDITLKHITYDKGSNLAGFYRLSNAGAWGSELDDEEPIHSYEGFLVQSDDNGKVATFHETAQRGAKSNGDNIKFIVANSEYSDATYALFDDCFGLNKINHRNSYIPMLYINQNNEDFAIAPMSDDTKSFNLNFKAMTTGKYTLSYKAKGEFNYLHIIDRITGEDVDMLLEGEYSFIASPNDSDNRFIVKLGYNAENNANNDIFAYQNGNDIVVEGEGELQVFDVTGRMVKIQRINGVQTINLNTQGVYIFRLNEKTQKIVVE